MTKSSTEGGNEDNNALRKRVAELEARLKKPPRRRKRRK
jgi:BMFP domain-containing protein YqiC